MKLAGEHGQSNVQTPPARPGSSLGSPGKKKGKPSSNKDYMFDTFLLKMDLVKFVSSVQNLKLAMATDGNFNPPNVEVPADAHNNITVYELSGNKDSDLVDLCVKVEEITIECWQTLSKLIKLFWSKTKSLWFFFISFKFYLLQNVV